VHPSAGGARGRYDSIRANLCGTRSLTVRSVVVVIVVADVNVCTEASGDSPLHVAATNGQLAAVQALLECGANINQTNATGWTALHQASVLALCVSCNVVSYRVVSC
jgi:hypothetical protein